MTEDLAAILHGTCTFIDPTTHYSVFPGEEGRRIWLSVDCEKLPSSHTFRVVTRANLYHLQEVHYVHSKVTPNLLQVTVDLLPWRLTHNQPWNFCSGFTLLIYEHLSWFVLNGMLLWVIQCKSCGVSPHVKKKFDARRTSTPNCNISQIFFIFMGGGKGVWPWLRKRVQS